ncbi:MAG: hypothetical protein EPO26_19215 [Chloroflexota bacterium]|nr:MAG: hypothetical protein EPO26_19215 [Chloroflexota bacterium]
MAEVAIVRRVFLLPGREADALAWLHHTEPLRRAAGQTRQFVVRGLIDSHEYQWIQFWRSYEAYDTWRRGPTRADLNDQRGRFMTHEPTRAYDVVE